MIGAIKFSVIIPACDRPQALLKAALSVSLQTLMPFEIIVVDNGSSPIPRNTLNSVNFENIKTVRALPRFGVSQARNLGAILATGTHLAFLDDDDQWESDYLEEIAKIYSSSDAEVVLGSRKNAKTGAVTKTKSIAINDQNVFLQELLKRNPGATGSSTTTTRSAFMASKGYDPYLTTGQDRALVLDLMLQGHKVARAERAYMLFDGLEDGERQNEPRKILQGKTRFLEKYGHLMDLKMKLKLKMRLLAKYKFNS